MKKLSLFLLLYSAVSVKAQDAYFFVQGNAGGWTNLAFQGTDTSALLSTTQQITNPKSSAYYYNTYNSFTQYLPMSNAWISLNMFTENAGNIIFTQHYGISFNKAIHLGKHFVWRNAIEVSYFNKRLDWNSLTFGDQIDPRQGFVYQSGDVPRGGSVGNIDFSYGTSFYYKKILLGFSAYHLNQPNESMVNGNAPLPVRLGIQLGYTFLIKEYRFQLQPYLNAFTQGTTNLASAGLKLTYNKNVSFAYGGVLSASSYYNIAWAGYKFRRGQITYGLSFGKSIHAVGCSHQVGVQFGFWKRKKSKRYFPQELGAFSTQ